MRIRTWEAAFSACAHCDYFTDNLQLPAAARGLIQVKTAGVANGLNYWYLFFEPHMSQIKARNRRSDHNLFLRIYSCERSRHD